MTREEYEARLERLRPSERLVLYLVREASPTTLSNAEIGGVLGLSLWTVSRHLTLLERLDLVQTAGLTSSRLLSYTGPEV